ncbi:MAG: hypothetical protein SCALA702_36340 [Melioribacteraceae bacterium]|nr:MAG: hypothetical protein SCALA702_36340 [Melioribacteraceae bacterium]
MFDKITYIKNTRRKKIAIKVLPFEGIIVEVPPGVPRKYAEQFVKQNQLWIAKAVSKVQAKEANYRILDERTVFTTRYRKIHFRKYGTKDFKWETYPDKGIITIPQEADFADLEVQKIVREILAEIFRDEAKYYLPNRTRELAQKFGFSFSRVFIKNHKSKWGSCSGRNNINLNLHLMRLPDELIDYVILHELTHTVEKNHGKRFWDKLESVCPGSRQLDKKLNLYSVEI